MPDMSTSPDKAAPEDRGAAAARRALNERAYRDLEQRTRGMPPEKVREFVEQHLAEHQARVERVRQNAARPSAASASYRPYRAALAMADEPGKAGDLGQIQAVAKELLGDIDRVLSPAPAPEAAPTAAKPSMTEELRALDVPIDAAVDAGDRPQVLKLVEQARRIIRDEQEYAARERATAQSGLELITENYTGGKEGATEADVQNAQADVDTWQDYADKLKPVTDESEQYYDQIIANLDVTPSPSDWMPDKPESAVQVRDAAEREIARIQKEADEAVRNLRGLIESAGALTPEQRQLEIEKIKLKFGIATP